ncbi:MAG: hypothetical protein ACI9MC_003346, partial [Kiritimatiellia bacterium]
SGRRYLARSGNRRKSVVRGVCLHRTRLGLRWFDGHHFELAGIERSGRCRHLLLWSGFLGVGLRDNVRSVHPAGAEYLPACPSNRSSSPSTAYQYFQVGPRCRNHPVSWILTCVHREVPPVSSATFASPLHGLESRWGDFYHSPVCTSMPARCKSGGHRRFSAKWARTWSIRLGLASS